MNSSEGHFPALRHLAVSQLDGTKSGEALTKILDGRMQLRSLKLHEPTHADLLCEVIAGGKVALEELELASSPGEFRGMSTKGCRWLTSLTRRLGYLDVDGNRLSHDDRAILEPLCDTLVFGSQHGSSGPWFVRHRKRQNWGLGRVISETGTQATIVFEDGKERTVLTGNEFLQTVASAEVPKTSPCRDQTADEVGPSRAESADCRKMSASLLAMALLATLRDILATPAALENIAARGRTTAAAKRRAREFACDIAVLSGGSRSSFGSLYLSDVRRRIKGLGLEDLTAEIHYRVAKRSGKVTYDTIIDSLPEAAAFLQTVTGASLGTEGQLDLLIEAMVG